MLPDALSPAVRQAGSAWSTAIIRLVAAGLALAALTFAEWREMAHQWWDIDTYNHVLLVPVIVAWLVWLRQGELAKTTPRAWIPGHLFVLFGLSLWLVGRGTEINLFAQAGVILAFQGAFLAVLGIRIALIVAFPLAYLCFLVPFGDELIPALQQVTASLTIALTHASGVPAVIDGLFIDTPAGRFVVAEECSGVKFLIAMVAFTVLLGWTGFTRWRPRIALVAAAAILSILANGVRAWGTIYVAQLIGIERAGGFDHIVYGWVFFAIVIAVVIAASWRWLDREPAEAGLTAEEASVHPITALERYSTTPDRALLAIAGLVIAFAALAALV
ncbi:exosortase A [Tsuneonella sp. HG094]